MVISVTQCNYVSHSPTTLCCGVHAAITIHHTVTQRRGSLTQLFYKLYRSNTLLTIKSVFYISGKTLHLWYVLSLYENDFIWASWPLQSALTGGFPSKRAGNGECVSMSWRHNGLADLTDISWESICSIFKTSSRQPRHLRLWMAFM